MDRLHSLTLGDLLRENRRRFPLRTAVVCGGERWTHPELDERVNRLANALLAAGFETDRDAVDEAFGGGGYPGPKRTRG